MPLNGETKNTPECALYLLKTISPIATIRQSSSDKEGFAIEASEDFMIPNCCVTESCSS